MTADYQQAQDGHPDVTTCRECGAVLEPDDTGWLCVTCEEVFTGEAMKQRYALEINHLFSGKRTFVKDAHGNVRLYGPDEIEMRRSQSQAALDRCPHDPARVSIYPYGVSDDALTRREYDEREEVENGGANN